MNWEEQYYNFIQEKIDEGKLIEAEPVPFDGIVYWHCGGGGFENRSFISKLDIEDEMFLNFCVKKSNENK